MFLKNEKYLLFILLIVFFFFFLKHIQILMIKQEGIKLFKFTKNFSASFITK